MAYSIRELELINNIYDIDLLDTLKREKLSMNFIIEYILNEKYQITRKEKDITLSTVLSYQWHLRDEILKIIHDENK